jgi:hypothetical protein
MKLDSVAAGSGLPQTMVGMCRYHLISHHLTTHRAEYFLNRMSHAYGSNN